MSFFVLTRREQERIFVHDGWEAGLSPGGELRIRLFGDWVLATGVRSSADILPLLSETPRPKKIAFDASELGAWDEVLIDFVTKLEAIAGERAVAVDPSALPRGVASLVALARAVPERSGARRTIRRSDFLTAVGAASLEFFSAAADFVAFLGETMIGLGRLIAGKARLRRSDVMLAIEECGPDALPAVGP